MKSWWTARWWGWQQLLEIGIKLSKSQIESQEEQIAKFLNRKGAENFLTNKKKFRYIDISKIVDVDTEVRSSQFPEVKNEWRNAVSNLTKRKKLFISQNLCLYYRYFYCLVKEKKTGGLSLISGFSMALSV